jgi:hypothetical protein
MPESQNLSLTNFELALTGGHPNSLGNTVAVVEEILNKPERIKELFDCYFSCDEVIRLRVSNAFKRISKQKPELVVPLLDEFITKISKINQASTQWTFAQLFLILDKFVTSKQKQEVMSILKHNLTTSNDWIVLNMTMETLLNYSKTYAELKPWLKNQLEKIAQDPRKSVASRANKYLKSI